MIEFLSRAQMSYGSRRSSARFTVETLKIKGPGQKHNQQVLAARLKRSMRHELPQTFNRASMPPHAIRCTHWLREAGASKGSAKYCVSCTTLPLRNSRI